MLCDWVSNYLKPSKNQTKCTLNPHFLAVTEMTLLFIVNLCSCMFA